MAEAEAEEAEQEAVRCHADGLAHTGVLSPPWVDVVQRKPWEPHAGWLARGIGVLSVIPGEAINAYHCHSDGHKSFKKEATEKTLIRFNGISGQSVTKKIQRYKICNLGNIKPLTFSTPSLWVGSGHACSM